MSPVRTATRTVGRVEAELRGDRGDLGERALEVLGDVDGQRLERRDVDDPRGAVDVVARVVGAVQAVDADEEPGERLARAGGRGDRACRGRRRCAASPRPAGVVGPSGKRRRNHSATAGWKPASAGSGSGRSSTDAAGAQHELAGGPSRGGGGEAIPLFCPGV